MALNVLVEYGAELANQTNDNGANVMHFLFCPFSECNDFENIFKALEYLQVNSCEKVKQSNESKIKKEKFSNNNVK